MSPRCQRFHYRAEERRERKYNNNIQRKERDGNGGEYIGRRKKEEGKGTG